MMGARQQAVGTARRFPAARGVDDRASRLREWKYGDVRPSRRRTRCWTNHHVMADQQESSRRALMGNAGRGVTHSPRRRPRDRVPWRYGLSGRGLSGPESWPGALSQADYFTRRRGHSRVGATPRLGTRSGRVHVAARRAVIDHPQQPRGQHERSDETPRTPPDAHRYGPRMKVEVVVSRCRRRSRQAVYGRLGFGRTPTSQTATAAGADDAPGSPPSIMSAWGHRRHAGLGSGNLRGVTISTRRAPGARDRVEVSEGSLREALPARRKQGPQVGARPEKPSYFLR